MTLHTCCCAGMMQPAAAGDPKHQHATARRVAWTLAGQRSGLLFLWPVLCQLCTVGQCWAPQRWATLAVMLTAVLSCPDCVRGPLVLQVLTALPAAAGRLQPQCFCTCSGHPLPRPSRRSQNQPSRAPCMQNNDTIKCFNRNVHGFCAYHVGGT